MEKIEKGAMSIIAILIDEIINNIETMRVFVYLFLQRMDKWSTNYIQIGENLRMFLKAG